MKAGQLRHRLRYEEPVKARDSFGQIAPGWAVVLALVWAEVRTPRGREQVVAQSFTQVADHVIVIRYPAGGIRDTGRFVDLDAQVGTTGVYSVVSATDEDGRKQSLLIYAASSTLQA